MKFKYTGPDDENVMRGVTFPKGKPVKVDDESLAAKISALDYFEEVKPKKAKANADKG
jgi:hypothetical protein